MRTSTGCRTIARRTLPDPTIPRILPIVGIIAGLLLGLVTDGIVIVRI